MLSSVLLKGEVELIHGGLGLARSARSVTALRRESKRHVGLYRAGS